MRALVLALLIVALLVLGASDIAAPLAHASDPPSIYNAGGGGYSKMYGQLKRLGIRAEAVEDLSQLRSRSPGEWILVVASPDRPLGEGDAEAVAGWIASGGAALILDELGTTGALLKILGIEISGPVREVGWASCFYSGRNATILINVFSTLRGGSPVCASREGAVASAVRLGSGEALVVGDSSLAINEVISRQGRGGPNPVFFLSAIAALGGGGRGVLFYEGGREFVAIRTSQVLVGAAAALSLLSYALSAALSSGPLGSAALVGGAALLAAAALSNLLGPPELPRKAGARAGGGDIRAAVEKGLERWRSPSRRD